MKKIGIILGGDVPTTLANKYGDYASMLIEKTRINEGAECVTLDATQGELPDDISSFDAFLTNWRNSPPTTIEPKRDVVGGDVSH